MLEELSPTQEVQKIGWADGHRSCKVGISAAAETQHSDGDTRTQDCQATTSIEATADAQAVRCSENSENNENRAEIPVSLDAGAQQSPTVKERHREEKTMRFRLKFPHLFCKQPAKKVKEKSRRRGTYDIAPGASGK